MSTSTSGNDAGEKHAAGAFDVRNVIAALIGFYGVVLVLMGIFYDSADDQQKTGGVNANLWAGLVMVLVAIAFAVWTRLRPVIVDEKEVAEARENMDEANH